MTALGSLSCHGVEAVMTVDGTTNAAVLRAYVSQALVPTLTTGDIVVMDNLASHKVDGIRATIEVCDRPSRCVGHYRCRRAGVV